MFGPFPGWFLGENMCYVVITAHNAYSSKAVQLYPVLTFG